MPWLIGVGAILAANCTPASLAQILVDLTIDGPATVFENTERQYCATAHFDDDSEFDVTIFCDWSVKPDTYASIDTFGRLTTLEVSQDQAIVVSASFTWRDVTLDDCLAVTIVDLPPDDEGDPWPEWQRNASRVGRAATVGPQTPTIVWSVQIDPGPFNSQQGATPVMDAQGRIFAAHHVGVAAVDSNTHEIIWQFTSDYPSSGVSLWNGRLLFGTPDDLFFCVDADTGAEIWSVPAEPHPNRGSVVDANGVVYYPSQLNVLYARRVADGSEVWTHNHPDFFNSAPALDGLGQLYIGNVDLGQWLAFDTSNGDIVWTFPSGASGTSPVENGRVYLASAGPRLLFCIDAVTGKEIWRFDTEFVTGGVVVGNDGTLYVNASGGQGWLFAVSPDGEELWRYAITNQGLNHPPIVDAVGNVYFCTYFANEFGWLHAVGPDGKGLWVKEMPNQVSASPMLAPDGTLYVVCRDKYLYAFKDPDVLGDLDGNGSVGAADLLALLASWGTCPDLPETCPADLDLNGSVGAADLLILLSNWG